jgi:glutamate-1-semialdehyde 2,1-aminomutase
MPTLAERSQLVFPAGCNGEFDLPAALAIVIDRGKGCELWDAEGRRMLDFSMGWGSVLIGHARPEIIEAVSQRVALGSNFAYVSAPAVELAEEIVRLSPACESVRFCASGTEATMYCMRLARAFTGKPRVLRFEGAYHGAHDVGVTSLFPPATGPFPTPRPTSDGLAIDAANSVLVAPFNDLETTGQILKEHASQLAAVIVEPLQRCVSPTPGFLQGLRELCTSHGVLLVFDEVVTGFRLAYGGAQEYYGVVPDLVAYGKALGGGMPIGAFGGSRDIMELVREDRLGKQSYVWVASTLGGNPVSSAAALATLRILRSEGTYDHLHKLGDYLRQGMRKVLQRTGLAAHVIGDGPLAQVIFNTANPRDYRTTRHSDPAFARRVMLELFRRGILLNPMGTKLYVSLAHNESVCDEFCDKFDEALRASG